MEPGCSMPHSQSFRMLLVSNLNMHENCVHFTSEVLNIFFRFFSVSNNAIPIYFKLRFFYIVKQFHFWTSPCPICSRLQICKYLQIIVIFFFQYISIFLILFLLILSQNNKNTFMYYFM